MADRADADPTAPPPLDELLAQRRWVRALARRLVATDERADDVAQTVWLEAMLRPPRRPGSARGWLATVTRNVARRLGRGEGRRTRHEAAALPQPARRGDAPADELVAAAEFQQRVAHAVLDLCEPYRTAVLLRYYEDLTPAEIGERLGVPVDTVRTRLRRALESLRGRLDRDHGGDRAAWVVALLAWDRGGTCATGPAGAANGAPSSETVVAHAAGGVAMGLAKKAAVAAAVVLAIAGGTALIGLPGPEDGEGATPGTDAAAGAQRAPRAARRAAPQTVPSDTDAIPAPVDLGLCDRDLDLHGTVVRADGTPVEGARIAAVAYPWRRAMPVHRRDEAVAGPRTRTARDGTFALRLERGALVSLRVTAPGLVDAERASCQAGERVRLVLAPGVRLRIECFEAIAADLAPAAGDDEAPRPADAQRVGAPRAGVRFRIFNNEGTDSLIVSREATTDAAGVATVADLPPSLEVFVGVLSDGIGAIPWTPVTLPAAGEVTRRVILPAGRTVRGRVTDAETGAPIAGARVGVGWMLRHAVATGADGTYALPGWTGAGDGGLEAEAGGCVRGRAFVRDSDVVDFALRPGFSATGRMVGADGAPVPGAFLTLIAATRTDDGFRMSRGHAVAAADGAFRIAGLDREMAHDLVAFAPGHGRILRAVSSPESGDLALGDVVLPASHVIAGRVVNARGEPVPRAQVVLRGPDAGAMVPGGSAYGASELRRTDDLGRFRFPDLAPGGYDLGVHVPEVPLVSARVVVAPGTAVVEREIVAGAGRSLVVRVTDEAGHPVAGSNVHLAFVGASEPGAQAWLKSGEDGVARFAGLARRVQSMARSPIATLLSTTWRDVPDDATEIALVLRTARRIRVRLLDASGRGIARATVKISRSGEIEQWAETDASGEFTTLVPNGVSFDFSGVIDGGESGWTARCDALPDGEEVTLRAHATPTDRTLRVRVESPDGEPIEGARVTVTHRMWHRQPGSVSDESGIAWFEGLPARPLRVTATNVGDWVLPAGLEVIPDGQEVVLRARRGVTIRGRLLRPGGASVRGRVSVRTVTVFGDIEEFMTRESDADGRFTLRVPEGAAGPFDVAAHAEVGRLDIYAYVSGVDAGDDVRLTLRPAPPR